MVVPEAHFTVFRTSRSGLPEVVSVNDALLSFRDIRIFRWHLCVTIAAVDVAENRLPSKDEMDVLYMIGDEIEDVVLGGRTEHDSNNAVILATSAWDATREVLFQVYDPEIAHAALQKLLHGKLWPRKWNYEMDDDPEWSNAAFLFKLFPLAKGDDA
ncbi:DUF695 domain-containing protein [Rhizobacter sp. Root1221]|uniref:DUF695 domain-containing protein n=1 Tax=Rhizobacter sp. Root1221 TaxID=1736433 RepID=UPI001F40EA20|nr:DUF695 domain-containing protein [Rhizobacter sp. Root1221]